MSFGSVPKNDFWNRENELGALMRLASPDERETARNVLLLGPRGIGKTELMKQAYRSLFWDDDTVIPFYYRFRRATLKARHFARDYFSRFLRQFMARLAGDPGLADNMSVPIDRLVARTPYDLYQCVSEVVDGFNTQFGEDDPPGLLFAAVSAPHVLAGCVGKRVVVMLDDFQLVRHVYENRPGDSEGAGSVFEETMKYPRAPHVICGSPENAVQEIFSDDALRGSADRITLGPLPEDAAFGLFEAQAKLRGAGAVSPDCRRLIAQLEGSPLYIRNIARAAGGTGAREVTAQSFIECYCRDVIYGETSSYWASVLAGCTKDTSMTPLAVELLSITAESPREALFTDRLARRLGAPEKTVQSLIDALGTAGLLSLPGLSGRDTVMEDFVRGTRMRISGEGRDSVLEAVRKNRFGRTFDTPLRFELVIPRASDTELVAVKAVEQICAGTSLGREDAQRLSMAIIEACINAMEHGGYDDRVTLKCSVYPERIEVAVESRGVAVDTEALMRKSEGMPGFEETRGRGFPLMNRLVDDIRVERAGDRTRVVLVKHIKGAEKT